MTVENTQNKMPPLQMGTTNEYPFNFAVLLQDPTAEEALEAIKASVLQADGTEVELVYNTDYTVTLNTDRIGGTLTVNDIRTSSDYITIYRKYAQTQEVDYKDFNSAPAETFEQCFDKLTMLSQQQQEEINRSIKLPVSSDITNLSLPNPIAGRTLKWNESETGLINSDVSIDEIDEFVKSANESAEIAVEKAEEIQGKLDEALEVADTIKDIEIIATLEIGDIGIAPLGIDETKGKRRYLNGQVIIQEQYVQFTNKVKSAVALYPSLACTESEWQTTATMTVGGQVGKFVVDDEAGTIRLPKIIMPIQGLTDLSKLGEIVEAGLPNIIGEIRANVNLSTINPQGAFSATSSSYGSGNGLQATENVGNSIGINASRSSSIYDNSDTVQQEQVQYPYFIQVATGAETENNITNTIELNNPFSFGDSKYSPQPLNNLSWLKSEGQWNSKAIYPSFYDWALINLNNGVKGFASSTGEYTDYDIVINPADETFRLPLLNGSESLPSDRYDELILGVSGTTYTAPANGWYILYKQANSPTSSTLDLFCTLTNDSSGITSHFHGAYGFGLTPCVEVKKGDVARATYDATGVTQYFRFVYAQGNGSLYFYVGETVQNANLINAGRIEEKLVDKVDKDSSWGFPSNRYIDLILGASGTTYTAPANGYVYIARRAGANNQYISAGNITSGFALEVDLPYTNNRATILLPVKKSDTYGINYTASGSDLVFRFIYAEGEV